MNIITSLYENYLLKQVSGSSAKIPGHVSLVLSEKDISQPNGFVKLKEYITWCSQLNIRIASIYVDVLDTEEELRSEMVERLVEKLAEFLPELPYDIGFEVYSDEGELCLEREDEKMLVYVSVGFGGRKEVTEAVLSILSDVRDGKLDSSSIVEETIESRLKVKHEPDIFIRSGGKHLSDFLIWQAVYSELYFTDVNWHNMRKLDILRIIRDFQKRQRRFGK
ncbi:undecaprenyl diphosphate synthase family protein [Methanolobus halotolerans]|uniref:UDP diphosphate synthase n=1 Tax=Methanolobus halotolerans TaxID=2052935 RepID=A0A4E0QD04_9EURY|nr:undecaprenyl diphosphate synthase family protein [Methanolobus halotolerans]TGC11127.1 UDP diphosphate synthase [Methanolobus halotolerans]